MFNVLLRFSDTYKNQVTIAGEDIATLCNNIHLK